MNKENLKKIAEGLIDTFNNAGKESIKLYNEGLKIQIKEDGSPVSNADLRVNEIISKKYQRDLKESWTRFIFQNLKNKGLLI